MDPNYEQLSQTLTKFTEPTSKCGGFVGDVPAIEVRIQVCFLWVLVGFYKVNGCGLGGLIVLLIGPLIKSVLLFN